MILLEDAYVAASGDATSCRTTRTRPVHAPQVAPSRDLAKAVPCSPPSPTPSSSSINSGNDSITRGNYHYQLTTRPLAAQTPGVSRLCNNITSKLYLDAGSDKKIMRFKESYGTGGTSIALPSR